MKYPNATKDDYISALLKLRDKSVFTKNESYLILLRAQCAAKNQTITAEQLAASIGYDDYQVANSQYGKLAHHIADALGYTPTISVNGNKPMWWMSLSKANDASDETIDGHVEFVMHNALFDALTEMKWYKKI